MPLKSGRVVFEVERGCGSSSSFPFVARSALLSRLPHRNGCVIALMGMGAEQTKEDDEEVARRGRSETGGVAEARDSGSKTLKYP